MEIADVDDGVKLGDTIELISPRRGQLAGRIFNATDGARMLASSALVNLDQLAFRGI